MSVAKTSDPATRDDVSRVISILAALNARDDEVHVLVVDGEPMSKARPRFSKNGHAYNSEKQRGNAEALAWRFRLAFKEPMVGNIAVACIFYRKSHQRIDSDNLLKQVLDSANTIVWADDCQVTAVAGIVERDTDRPRTVLAFAPHISSMDRGDRLLHFTCGQCGIAFSRRVHPSQSNPKFCSRACHAKSNGERAREIVQCVACGKDFERRRYSQKLCSNECVRALVIQARKVEAARCVECGATLSKQGYIRCRECWRVKRSSG